MDKKPTISTTSVEYAEAKLEIFVATTEIEQQRKEARNMSVKANENSLRGLTPEFNEELEETQSQKNNTKYPKIIERNNTKSLKQFFEGFNEENKNGKNLSGHKSLELGSETRNVRKCKEKIEKTLSEEKYIEKSCKLITKQETWTKRIQLRESLSLAEDREIIRNEPDLSEIEKLKRENAKLQSECRSDKFLIAKQEFELEKRTTKKVQNGRKTSEQDLIQVSAKDEEIMELLQKQIKDKQTEVEQENKKEKEKLERKIQELNDALEKQKGDCEYLKYDLKSLQTELKENKQEFDKIFQVNNNTNRRNMKLENEKKELQKEIGKLQTSINILKAKTRNTSIS